MVEAHGDTVHVYVQGSDDPYVRQLLDSGAVGSPLDGWTSIRSVQVEGLSAVGEEQVWQVLGSHAGPDRRLKD